MLTMLKPKLDADKERSLISCLENSNTAQVMPAEFEIAMLWSISQVAHLEIEPKFLNLKRLPDAFSENLFSKPSIIEITALSDDPFKEDMDRAANIIVNFSNSILKNSGKHLHFRFLDESGYAQGKYFRNHCVSDNFQLDDNLKGALRWWLSNPEWPSPEKIRLKNADIDVVIEWKKHVNPHFKAHGSMPAIASNVEDNIIYRALREKRKQLSGSPPEILKCVFIGDVGCDLLRNLTHTPDAWSVSGDKIIRHCLTRFPIDIVCVFSPSQDFNPFFGRPSTLSWKVYYYSKSDNYPEDQPKLLEELSKKIPRPRAEAYKIRSLHRQGFFVRNKSRYLPTKWTYQGSTLSMRISARLIQDFLAGRVSLEDFNKEAFDGKNQFEEQLCRGSTFDDVCIEKAGLDEDDDYLVFKFSPDFAEISLKSGLIEKIVEK